MLQRISAQLLGNYDLYNNLNYILLSPIIYYFRPAKTSATLASIKKNTQEDLWRHSREPMKAPLLKKLQRETERFQAAIVMFNTILKYMGELPRSHNNALNTDSIFEPAVKDELLRDELYCQIMRQLTDNRIQISEERGWELMWLATGTMVPSTALFKELQEFLRTRNHPLAVESLERIQKVLKNGPRKFPPYIIEVESIRNRTLQIYHKVIISHHMAFHS